MTMTKPKYPYLMSERYCKHWTIQMAIRELIANAIDASDYTDVSISWDDGIGVITNSKTILEKRHLLLGESDKKGESIGQFGEGLKLAALVLTREKRDIRVESGAYKYTFSMADNPEFGCRTLFVEVDDLDIPINGTKVIFTANKREVGSAKMLFRVFNNVTELAGGILESMGGVYVMGVHICTLSNSYLGYDLSDKSLINRDRTMVDRDKVDNAIQQMISQTASEAVIENLLLSCVKHPDSYEGQLYFYAWYPEHWKNVVHRIWGEKVCVTTPENQTADERAEYLGYKILNFGSEANRCLTNRDILPRSSKVNPAEVTKTVSVEQLEDVEKDVLSDAKSIMESLLGRTLKLQLHITEELADETILQHKLSEGKDADVYVNRRYLTKPVSWIAGYLLHELAHIESGGVDCSIAMQNKLSDYLIEIAEVATRKWIR